MESLILAAKAQNFVPVVDDSNTFIGIIKRGDIISYCYKRIFEEDDSNHFSDFKDLGKLNIS